LHLTTDPVQWWKIACQRLSDLVGFVAWSSYSAQDADEAVAKELKEGWTGKMTKEQQ